MLIIFQDSSMFHEIFLSPHGKQSTIISNKHDLYELPHKLPNNLGLKILENQEISGESQNFLEL